MREEYEVLAKADQRRARFFAEAALLGAVEPESAAVLFRERLSAPSAAELAQGFPWWAMHRDTMSLRLARARAESLAQLPHSADWTVAKYVAYLDRLTLAQLLSEQRRDSEAWQILLSSYPASILAPWPNEALWLLLRGRVGERLSERESAAQAYAWVAGMWRSADPELQPYVTEAREGLARLSAERK